MDSFLAGVLFAFMLVLMIWGAQRLSKPFAARKRVADRGTLRFDWMPGGHLTPKQVDCLCDVLAEIDAAREDAPPGTPVRTTLDRLHEQVDRLAATAVK